MRFPLKAQVRAGRLHLDEPINLPDGTEVTLLPAEDGDELGEADRARLHASLERSAEQFAQGQGIPAEEALRRLRNR